MLNYDRSYFEGIQARSNPSANVIVPLVLELSGAQSVLDVGCGVGSWLRAYRSLGVQDVVGLDGDYIERDMLEIPPDRFLPRDLLRAFDLGRTFDLVMSVEVAEHLPPGRAPGFVDDLTRHGSLVMFSAAIPSQGGENHLNEQWPSYWADLFAAKGYVAVDCLRRRIWDDERVAFWYAQNLVLYVTPERLEQLPALKREHNLLQGRVPNLVHPSLFRWYVDWGISECKRRWEAEARSVPPA